jgi:hypothetical protein
MIWRRVWDFVGKKVVLIRPRLSDAALTRPVAAVAESHLVQPAQQLRDLAPHGAAKSPRLKNRQARRPVL